MDACLLKNLLGRWLMFRDRKRRDRLYIMAEVLEIAKNGSLKTQIMYRANLSFAQLNDYLDFLLEVGLLRESSEEGKTVYGTTKKGVRFLRNYYKIRDLLRGKSEKSEKNNLNNRARAHANQTKHKTTLLTLKEA